MDTQKIEKYLETVEKGFGRDNLLRILSGEEMEPDPSASPARLHRIRLKSHIRECLPASGNTSVRKIAKKSYQLAKGMNDKILDPEISTKFQEFIEVATKEHIISGLEFFFDELKVKEKTT